MKLNEILGNAVGVLGIIVSIILYQQKKGKNILRWKLCSDLVWLVQYLLLGKYTGAGSCVVGVIRETIFLNQHRRWAKSKLWLLFFLVLSIVMSIATWSNPYSALPMIASAIAVFSFWRSNPTLTKILCYPICFCMLTYDIFGAGSVAYMGVANEILTLTSTTVSLILMHKAKKSDGAPEADSCEEGVATGA